MKFDKTQLAKIFNEWANRYAKNPSEFEEMLDSNGVPIVDYGEQCAEYFAKLADELK